LSRVSVSFTEKNLVPNAGLLPAAALAQRVGLGDLVDQRLRLAGEGANSGSKALTVIGSMLVGGDSIDDTAVLRAGAAGPLFDDTRAPSTVGSWLRAHKWSNVRELDAVSRQLLARLWAAGAGPGDLSGPLTIDLDSSIVPVYGRAKQGAAFGYTKVRGYHPQFATCAETGRVLFSRLRGGSAGAARGAKSFLTETVSRVREAGSTGQLTVRADSAFYSRAVLGTAVKLGVEFSVTARQDKKVRAAIEAIEETAWTPIPYWLSTPEVSGADVAETTYTAFTGNDAMTVRLVVRRVRPTPGTQLALFTTWDYHAFVTNTRRRPPGRGRPPSPRRGRAADRRAQERRARASAVWEVHGQRRLALAGRDGPQPRPGRGTSGRARPREGHRHHPAATHLHYPRTTRPQRTTPTSTTTRRLALGGGHRPSARQSPRHPAALLTTSPTPTTRTLGEAGRPANPACPGPPRGRPRPRSPRNKHTARSAVDPG
jgi:hypothetical protein